MDWKNELKKIAPRIYFLNGLAAYLVTCAAAMVTGTTAFDDIAFVGTVPVREVMICTALVFALLMILERFLQLKGLPVLVSAVFCCLLAVCIRTSDVYFTVCCIAALGLLLYYLAKENLVAFQVHLSERGLAAFVTAEYAVIGGLTAYANVLRYQSYHSSTFDLGIFAQMYECMANTGLMSVSCERNVLDNHLLRHFSPIFYLLLPLYMLFRTPAFLVAIQPLTVLSGVLPLTLLCRKRGLSHNATAALASVFLCYPTLTAACYYDFHENMFLTPVLLWLLYFVECDRTKGIIICSVLTAMIKEDAGMYLCCIGCYLIFYKCRIKAGLLMNWFALTVFFAATAYINAFGDSTLSTQHYSNLIPPGERGLLSALQTVVLDPGYLMTQMLSAEKIVFLLQMLLPLLFLPLLGKKLSRLFLALPLCAVSLITTYPYQFDIDFQYSFGTGALLLYMAVGSWSELKSDKCKRMVLAMMVLASALLMLNNNVPKYRTYRDIARDERQMIRLTDGVIDSIDENASVTASTFLVPKLYRHRELYMLDSDCIAADYVLIDARFRSESEQEERNYYDMGYVNILEQGYVIVLKKPD